MKKLLSILFLLGVTATTLNAADISYAQTAAPAKTTPAVTTTNTKPALIVKPIDVVNNPSKYMQKRICMTARFSKFATLGLDYKPAFRSSDNYISFVFLRDDSANNIPLSELKMFIPRKTAEKLPDIKEGDKVKVIGTVFSNALGDAWVDAESLTLLNAKKTANK